MNQLDIHGIPLMSSCSNPITIMIADFRKKELSVIIRNHPLILIEDNIHSFLTTSIIFDYQQPMSNILLEQSV